MVVRPGTPRLLRELNDRAALELLLAGGPMTRAQIGERTGLSKVTASQLLARLEERGLVETVGEQAGGRGPNAALYAVVPSSAMIEPELDVRVHRHAAVRGRVRLAVFALTVLRVHAHDVERRPDVRRDLFRAEIAAEETERPGEQCPEAQLSE